MYPVVFLVGGTVQFGEGEHAAVNRIEVMVSTFSDPWKLRFRILFVIDFG